jgi:hypothetical protein
MLHSQVDDFLEETSASFQHSNALVLGFIPEDGSSRFLENISN